MALSYSGKRTRFILVALLLVLSIFSGFIYSVVANDAEHTYVIFEDDFEDGDASDWMIDIPPEAPPGSSWAVELDDGNYVLSEEGQVWAEAGDYAWTNYTFEVKVKLIKGGVSLNFRLTEPWAHSRYFIDLSVGDLHLRKEYPSSYFSYLNVTEVGLNPNMWYTVKVVCVGNHLEVYVDDALKISYADNDDPILSGRIGLESSPDCHGHFDDVRVSTTQRLYTIHLINIAQHEIDKAKEIGADTSEAEKKLEEAKINLDIGNLDVASSLAQDAIELAKHASVGLILVGELLDHPERYDQRTVELLGTIRDISYDQGVYRFFIDDDSGVVSTTFNGSLGDVKSEDSVRVVGIFDASTMTVVAEILEKIAKLPGEELHTYVIFEDDFEDGDYEGWTTGHEGVGAALAVEVEDGNHVLSGKGGEGFYDARPWESRAWPYITDKWTDYTFEIRFKLIKTGNFELTFRMTDWSYRYWFNVNPWEYNLGKQTGPRWPEDFHQLDRREEALDLNRWYTLKIVCIESNLKVYIDDVLKIRYVDTDKPHLSGGIALSFHDHSYVHFDDVRVSTTQRLYVDHLINVAQYEIDKAKEIAADTSGAELKFAEAQAAFRKEDLSSAEALAKEAIDLARHAYVGPISVNELLKYSDEYDQRTVEVSGTIRDIRYEQGVYRFAVDDGTGVISAAFNETLGEIKSEDEVKVIGMFDASTKTVIAKSLEKLKPPTEGLYTFLIFKDDFEDGDFSDWMTDINPEIEGSVWKVEKEGDNYVLSGEGDCWSDTGDPEWTDYIFEFKIKLIKGEALINFRMTPKPPRGENKYVLHMHLPSHLYLEKMEVDTIERSTDLKHVSVDLSPDAWYAVKIICLENNIKIYLNDALKFDYVDEENPLLSGMIGLAVSHEERKPSHIHFDDVKVSKIATTGDINDLINYAQSEIDKAREINADVSGAELKLEQAKQALAQENYQLVQYLVDEAVWLAKRASIGSISIKDLKALATRYSGHTVELTGTVKDMQARYGAGYEFDLDDGTEVIHVLCQVGIVDIDNEYKVKIIGTFDAPSETVTASKIEKISGPPITPPEQPLVSIPWTIENVATLLSIAAMVGGGIAAIVRHEMVERRRKHVGDILDEIDDVYTRFKTKARRCEAELYKLRNLITDELKRGKLNEENYTFLDNKIDDYMREIQEQIEKEK